MSTIEIPSTVPSGEPPAAEKNPLRIAGPRRLRWDYLIVFVVFHALALLACVPWLFSWTGVILFVLGVLIFGQLAIPIGYHRLLTHRSFKVPKWFERSLVTLALCSAQETPAKWVAWHRMHHQYSDEPDDPHTPTVSFFWAHVNWLVHDSKSKLQTYNLYERYARDILKDPYYRWVEKLPLPAGFFFLCHAAVFALASFTAGGFLFGWGMPALQFMLSIMVWGVILRTVYVWHITWSVNSLSHIFGYRNHETRDDSRNNWFVTLLTAGEGWHNNHHADPTSATVQHRWWEIDLNYYVIKIWEWMGLATDVVPRLDKRRETKEV